MLNLKANIYSEITLNFVQLSKKFLDKKCSIYFHMKERCKCITMKTQPFTSCIYSHMLLLWWEIPSHLLFRYLMYQFWSGCVDSAGLTNLIVASPVEQHMSLSSSPIQSMPITSLNLHMNRWIFKIMYHKNAKQEFIQVKKKMNVVTYHFIFFFCT